MGGLEVRELGYVQQPPASNLKRITPPTPLIRVEKNILILVKKDFAIEGL